jgi:hypothetical protein
LSIKIIFQAEQTDYLNRNLNKLADAFRKSNIEKYKMYKDLADKIVHGENGTKKLVILNTRDIAIIQTLCTSAHTFLTTKTIPKYKKFKQTSYLSSAELAADLIKSILDHIAKKLE